MSNVDEEFARIKKTILDGFIEQIQKVVTIYGEDKRLVGLLA